MRRTSRASIWWTRMTGTSSLSSTLMDTSSRMHAYVISGRSHYEIRQESIPIGRVLIAALATGGEGGVGCGVGILSQILLGLWCSMIDQRFTVKNSRTAISVDWPFGAFIAQFLQFLSFKCHTKLKYPMTDDSIEQYFTNSNHNSTFRGDMPQLSLE